MKQFITKQTISTILTTQVMYNKTLATNASVPAKIIQDQA
jgi:hypothetical protein